jgi:hypothetical protein
MATFVRYTHRGGSATRAVNLDTVQRAEWGTSADGVHWFCWVFARGGEHGESLTVWERGATAQWLARHLAELAADAEPIQRSVTVTDKPLSHEERHRLLDDLDDTAAEPGDPF